MLQDGDSLIVAVFFRGSRAIHASPGFFDWYYFVAAFFRESFLCGLIFMLAFFPQGGGGGGMNIGCSLQNKAALNLFFSNIQWLFETDFDLKITKYKLFPSLLLQGY